MERGENFSLIISGAVASVSKKSQAKELTTVSAEVMLEKGKGPRKNKILHSGERKKKKKYIDGQKKREKRGKIEQWKPRSEKSLPQIEDENCTKSKRIYRC